MKVTNQTIFIIDDNFDVREALRALFESVYFRVETFENAPLFLKQYKNTSGCLIADVRMPIMSGLELLEQLRAQKCTLPVIIITGYGDIEMAIRAMKLGAVDFILKPINDQSLLDIVQKHLQKNSQSPAMEDIHQRAESLSQRERQILTLMLEGKLNKEIAFELSISMSTVEAHRAHIMKKMKAKNLAHLIRLCLQTSLMDELA